MVNFLTFSNLFYLAILFLPVVITTRLFYNFKKEVDNLLDGMIIWLILYTAALIGTGLGFILINLTYI